MSKKSKNLYNVDGLKTCSICNFALTALAHAGDDAARNKTLAALEKHLAATHKYSAAEIAERMKAAEVMTNA